MKKENDDFHEEFCAAEPQSGSAPEYVRRDQSMCVFFDYVQLPSEVRQYVRDQNVQSRHWIRFTKFIDDAKSVKDSVIASNGGCPTSGKRSQPFSPPGSTVLVLEF